MNTTVPFVIVPCWEVINNNNMLLIVQEGSSPVGGSAVSSDAWPFLHLCSIYFYFHSVNQDFYFHNLKAAVKILTPDLIVRGQ